MINVQPKRAREKRKRLFVPRKMRKRALTKRNTREEVINNKAGRTFSTATKRTKKLLKIESKSTSIIIMARISGWYRSGWNIRKSNHKNSVQITPKAVSYTHLRAHETRHDLVCRLL